MNLPRAAGMFLLPNAGATLFSRKYPVTFNPWIISVIFSPKPKRLFGKGSNLLDQSPAPSVLTALPDLGEI